MCSFYRISGCYRQIQTNVKRRLTGMGEAESSRFWWLWHNKFYETTGLTGYAFINNAKTKVEAILWYATIMLLAIFALNNVAKLVRYYQSKPTKTEVRISSNASDATIGNFTLKLKLPIAEIYTAKSLAQWDYLNKRKPLSCVGGSDLLETMGGAYSESSDCLPRHLIPLIKTYNTHIPKHLGDYIAECEMPRDRLNTTYTSIVETKKVIQNLNKRFSKNFNAIWSEMTKLSYITNVTTTHDYVQNFLLPSHEFNAKMHENVNVNFFTPFLLLKSMSDATIHNDFPFMKLFNATQYFEHSALSPKETLEEISTRLLDIAPFVLPPSLSYTKFFMRDWTVDFGDISYKWHDRNEEFYNYPIFGNSFTVEFQVRPPEGVQEFTMVINPPKQFIKFLYPFFHLDHWLFDRFLVNKEGWKRKGYEKEMEMESFLYHLTACDITDWEGEIDLSWSLNEDFWLWDYFTTAPRNDFLGTFVYPAFDFYRKYSELKINTGGGQVIVKPFHKHHINQLPTGRMVSQTDDCTSITFDECVDLCQSNYTVEKCECYPWNLHYLHTQSDIEICSEPCPGSTSQKDLCLSKCEQLSAHPCDRIMYRPEIINQQPITVLEENEINDYDLTKGETLLDDFFTVKITIEQTMAYVKTVEMYQMTFTNFISELGGLVDFWLGVNVIGIIHAFVYFLKQCCHCNREHKTGRTIRRLAQCTDNNEVRSTEEESGAGVTTPNMLAKMQLQMDRRLTEMNRKMMKENSKQNKRFTEMNRKIANENINLKKRIKQLEDRLEKY